MNSLKKAIPAALFCVVLVILYGTSYPSVGWWDSGMYASSSYNLGVPGPGASVLFILIGRVFTTVLFFLPPIKAVTLVSIISTASASVVFYYTILYLLENLDNKSAVTAKSTVAALTALTLPFLYSIWSEAYVTRAYTLGLFLSSLILYCVVKIWFGTDEDEKKRLFLFTVYLIALDYGAHRLSLPFVPVLLVLLIVSLRKHLLSLKFWGKMFLLAAAGLSVHLILLIRSQMNPPMPLDSVKNLSQLWAWITMKRFGQSNFSMIFDRRAPFWDYQLNYMYLRYFGWNFLGTKGSGFVPYLAGIIPLLLGLIGVLYSFIKKFKAGFIVFLAFLFFSFGLIVYSNTSMGFDKIREIDRLFLPSFMIFLIWVGIGLYAVFAGIEKLVPKRIYKSKFSIVVLSILAFLILPFNVFSNNFVTCDKSGFYFPADFSYNLLVGCGKNGVLFTNGDNDTYPLWYLQNMEGVRKDVNIVNLSLLNTDYYLNYLMHKDNPLPFDSSFADMKDRAPMRLKDTMNINIPVPSNYVSNVSVPDTFKFNYAGRQFGKIRGMLVQDMALISFLKQNKWNRPVYFSTTVDSASMLGLSKYTVLEGSIRELKPYKPERIDPELMYKNLTSKYRYRNFNNPNQSVDRVTLSLLNNFRHEFYALSIYYLDKGDKLKAQKIFDIMNSKLPSWRFGKTQNFFIEKLAKRLGK